MRKKIQGISFDFGGTLSKQQAPSVIHQILSDEGITCEAQVIERAFAAVEEQDALTATRSEFRGYTQPGDESDYVRLNRLILARAGVARHQSRLARLINEKWSEYAAAVGREAFSDVKPCLEELRQANLKMGVVSNIDSKEELEKGLLDLKVRDYFAVLVASGAVGYVKPNPEIFRIASEEMKLQPEALVHVGDLYAVDVLGAESAGLTGILLDRENRLPIVRCERIRGLGELPSLIEGL